MFLTFSNFCMIPVEQAPGTTMAYGVFLHLPGMPSIGAMILSGGTQRLCWCAPAQFIDDILLFFFEAAAACSSFVKLRSAVQHSTCQFWQRPSLKRRGDSRVASMLCSSLQSLLDASLRLLSL